MFVIICRVKQSVDNVKAL